jgi:hypothetical protein
MGIRPTTPLPALVNKGATAGIGAEWEELYEYLPWEATPLARNDAFPTRVAVFRSTRPNNNFPAILTA